MENCIYKVIRALAHLDQHEPPREEPLPDDPELVPPDGVAAVEQLVELELGKAEPVEAKLPEAHVLERGLGVLPGLEPVGGGEGHQVQEPAGEAGDAGVEEGARGLQGGLLLLLHRVCRRDAARHFSVSLSLSLSLCLFSPFQLSLPPFFCLSERKS